MVQRGRCDDGHLLAWIHHETDETDEMSENDQSGFVLPKTQTASSACQV